MKLQWDPAKAAQNLRKHGVSFEEAKAAFYDDLAVQFFDDEHSSEEDRSIPWGMSSQAKPLVVCHCERGQGQTVRIVSARKATKREKAFYPGG
jgi:uncharacterized protein